MKKALFIPLIAFLLASSLSFAQEHNKIRVGLGWYSTSAPIGGRILFNNNIGVDLGLGYADKNFLGSNEDRFHVNVGVLFNAVKTGPVNFFIRPGVELQTNARTVGSETKSKLIVTADTRC